MKSIIVLYITYWRVMCPYENLFRSVWEFKMMYSIVITGTLFISIFALNGQASNYWYSFLLTLDTTFPFHLIIFILIRFPIFLFKKKMYFIRLYTDN